MVLKQIVAQMGVEAVVENLGNFARDMDSMNRLIDKFTSRGEKMERTFRPVNAVLNAFGESLKRIAEFVIAGLIVRGIEKITSAVMNMVSAMISAGAEFQTLTIRLEGLLAREILDTGAVQNFGDALMAAVPFAKDLFFWIQKLALQTPFDIKDIANTITLAKSYGFTAEQAKILTTEIVNFSSGMGLSNIQMERIIINFGQMIQQGKITGMELRDLARGAFVPVNRVLDVMKENLGLTTDEYEKMRKEGTNQVMPFIEAFIQVVREDFPDAGKRASRTIQAVAGNIKDLVQGVLGFNIVKPVLDVISTKMAEFLDILTTGVRGDRLIKITEQIGQALSGIIEVFFGKLPAGETIADFIIDTLDKLKGKLIGIQDIIRRVSLGEATAIQGLSAVLILLGLPEDLVARMGEILLNIRNFVFGLKILFGDLKAGELSLGAFVRAITKHFLTLIGVGNETATKVGFFLQDIITSIQNFIAGFKEGGIIGGLKALEIPDLFGEMKRRKGGEEEEGILAPIIALVEGIQTTIENFKTFWDENKDTITGAITSIINSFLGEEGIVPTAGKTFIEIFTDQLVRFSDKLVEKGPEISQTLSDIAEFIDVTFLPAFREVSEWIIENQDEIIDFFVGFRLAAEALGIIFKIVTPIVLLIIGALMIFGAPLLLLIGLIPIVVGLLFAWGEGFVALWEQIKTMVGLIINKLIFLRLKAEKVLRKIVNKFLIAGRDAIAGFRRKFLEGLERMKTDFIRGITDLVNTIRVLLGIGSESKVFRKIGENMQEGLAAGIMGAINLPKKAMDLTVSHVVSATTSPLQAMPVPINRITTQNFNQNVVSNARTDETIANFRTLEALATLDTG